MAKFVGTEEVKISTGMDELMPIPTGWSLGYVFKRISFRNKQSCTILVDGVPLYLGYMEGFQTEYSDPNIKSFIIVEPNIEYHFIGVV